MLGLFLLLSSASFGVYKVCFFGVPLQTNRENEFYSKLADLHLEKYNFPVEMIICLPNGTVV